MKKETRTSYYPNGKRWYETPYINNQIHGLVTGWCDNGKKRYKIPFKKDLEHGSRIYFRY